MDLPTQICETIKDVLPDATVIVRDPHNDGVHLEAIVISQQFETLSLVKQHQIVMKALEQHFSTELHALALKTLTPQQWDREQQQNQLGVSS